MDFPDQVPFLIEIDSPQYCTWFDSDRTLVDV